MTSLLYVVREGDNEELRHSLRSVAENLPHDEVWVAGRPPEWLADKVGRIETPDRGKKWANIVDALTAACGFGPVPDDLLYLNDDMFIMEPLDSIPVYHRGPLRRRGVGIYGQGFADTAFTLRKMGAWSGLLDYELHVPLPIQKPRMYEALGRASHHFRGYCLHARTLYGNAWGIGGEQIDDVKVYGSDPAPPGALLSTNDSSFAHYRAGKLIRERFPEPGPYEKRSSE